MKTRIQHGFTLIELMIAIVVIGILAAIAMPGYQSHIVKANRAAAQAEIMDIANREQQYFLVNRAYGDAIAIGYTLPSRLSSKYTATITPTAASTTTPPSFLITFAPQDSQASDGTLTLNSDGVKTPSDKW